MDRIKVVIGANFGDEGKGRTSSFFSKEAKEHGKVLNVLYNGGIQRGHTADGFVYHCFGAGTAQGADTYYDQRFLFDPIAVMYEYEKLKQKPKLYIHPSARIITPFDAAFNQSIETKRGTGKHGSCGIGIYEAYNRGYYLPIYYEDLFYDDRLFRKLNALINEWIPYREQQLGVSCDCNFDVELLVKAYKQFRLLFAMLYPDIFRLYNTVIFEGGQGLMLDMDNKKFSPHLTPSKTGSSYVAHYFEEAAEVEVCYVTRTYFTRHGAGPFPTECKKEDINPEIIDKTNQPNEFQDSIRYGFFDPDQFIKGIEKDEKNYEHISNVKETVSITHNDYTRGLMACKNARIPFDELFPGKFSKVYNFSYYSEGENYGSN